MSSPWTTIDGLPAAIRSSRLYERGGYEVVEGLLAPDEIRQLTEEAWQQRAVAIRHEIDIDEVNETRGGKPRRRFSSSPGGPFQHAFYQSPDVLAALRAWTGVPLKSCGANGTYSYYERPGDYLELHRDIVTCDMALITVLHDNSPARDVHGALELYPNCLTQPISQVRGASRTGAVRVKICAGQSLVFYGGYIPHRLLPLGSNQLRIISVLCYEAAGC